MPGDDPDYVERVRRWLVRDGRDDAAEQLKREAAAPRQGKPTVFVVGEDKRGKSTLVNALLGRADASPTGVESVTGAPISFVHANRPRAVVYRYGEREGVETDVAAAQALATINGDAEQIESERIRSVRIGLPVDLLDHLTLVDTPGVGGLESGHAALTMQSLRRADALVFVIEAGAQLRSAEIEFLARATERVDTVVIALTKTDKYRGWRTIAADNARILREHAPRFADAPVLPVAALLAVQALAAPDPEDAVLMREDSGVDALADLLRTQVAARVKAVRRTNVVRMALSEVLAAERTLRDQLPTADPAELQTQLDAEKQRLIKLKEDRADWPAQLDAELRRLTLERTELANSELAEIRHRYENKLRGLKKTEFDPLPAELIADLVALDSSLNEDASARIRVFLTELLAELDNGSALTESMSALADTRLSEELSSMSFGEYKLSTTDKMSILTMFNRGSSVTSLLTGSSLGLTTATFLAPPLGTLLGIGVGSLLAVTAFRGRAQTAYGAEFRSWMQEQMSQAQLTINSGFQRALVDVQAGIKRMIRNALIQRESEVTESLNAVKVLLASDTRERERLTKEINRKLEEIERFKTEAAKLFLRAAQTPAVKTGVSA